MNTPLAKARARHTVAGVLADQRALTDAALIRQLRDELLARMDAVPLPGSPFSRLLADAYTRLQP